jgi:hypothetical protein
MLVAVVSFGAGLVISGLLLVAVLRSVPGFWDTPTAYSTGRIEKACDSVTSFVAFLIPAALAVTTWVYEKTGTLWYGAFLALSTFWFLLVLVFTMYMRFNFVWRLPARVTVGGGHNMEVAQWLATVMLGLSAGLIFLAIPTFVIAFRASPDKERKTEMPVYNEYHIDKTERCAPCPPPPPPVHGQASNLKSGPKEKKER